MDVTFRNLTNQGLVISFYNNQQQEQQVILQALSIGTYQLSSITQATQGLIDQGYIKVENGTPLVKSYQTTVAAVPLSYVGPWVQGANVQRGNVLSYGGNHWVVLNPHKTINFPSDSNPDWVALSVFDSSSFLGIDVDAAAVGSVIFKGNTSWEAGKITDDQVDTISQSKITNLGTTLGSKLSLSGGTMTGALSLFGNPTNTNHAVNKGYADSTFLGLAGGTLTGALTLSGAPTAANHAANKGYVDGVFGAAISGSGGTITGRLVLNGPAPNTNDAVNRSWVEGNMLALTGGTLTGNVVGITPTQGTHLANCDWVDARFANGTTVTGDLKYSGSVTANAHVTTKGYVETNFLKLSGGTMSGLIKIATSPSDPQHLTNKAYVDSLTTNKLPLGGGTMTGFIVLHADPTSAMHPASKQYVDNIVTGGAGAPLLISGGTMTGGIGLAVISSSTGLHLSAPRNSTLTYGTQILQSFAEGIGESSTSGAALQGIETIDADLEAVVREMPAAADLPVQERLVIKGDTTPNPVYVVAGGAGSSGTDATYVLSEPNEAIGWISADGRWVARGLSAEIAKTLSVRTEDAGSGVVDLSAKNLVDAVLSVTAVTDQAGSARLTVPSTTGIVSGSQWRSTDNTGAYPDLLFTITGIVSGTQIDTDQIYISNDSFAMLGQLEEAGGSKRVVLKLSVSPSDPFDDPPDDWSIALDNDGFKVSGTNTFMVFQTLGDGTGQIEVNNVGGTSTGYLHVLSAGRKFGSISATASKTVTAASEYVLQNVTLSQDGGIIALILGSGETAMFEVGETITIANGGGYNGAHEVLNVLPDDNIVLLSGTYTTDDTVDISWAGQPTGPVALEVDSLTNLSVGTIVSISGVTRLGGEDVLSAPLVHLDPGSINLAVVRAAYSASGTQTGTMSYSPVLKLTI